MSGLTGITVPDVRTIVSADPAQQPGPALTELASSILATSSATPQLSEVLIALLAKVLLSFVLKCAEDHLFKQLTLARDHSAYRGLLRARLALALPADFGTFGQRQTVADQMIAHGISSMHTPAWSAVFHVNI
jgi:hypothetical protein